MGSETLERQTPPGAPRPIVAFDFDGTLTIRDSYTDFLRWRAGPLGYAAGLAGMGPALLAYARTRDRGALKAAATRRFLAGLPRAALEAAAHRYCQQAWARLMRPDALEAWAAHGAEGCERVIVTASPVEVVAPFARRLAADRLIGTRLAFDSENRAAGGFVGPNCRGPEKVARLQAAFGPQVRLMAAYGDTGGDVEMLALAERPGMKVFTARP